MYLAWGWLARMGKPLLARPNRSGQELGSHLILASEFLATQIDHLTRFSVPLRLRPRTQVRDSGARRQPPGQQGLVVIDRASLGQGHQQFAQVAVAVDAIDLTGLGEAARATMYA